MTHLRFARLTTAGTITAALFAGTALAQDDCATATAISVAGSYVWDNTGFGDSLIDPGAPCLAADGVTAGSVEKDYWFEYTVDVGGGDIRIDTNGTGDDTVMQISTGPCGSEVCVAFDDDGGNGTESLIDLIGQVGGEVYLIQVGQFQGQGQAQAASVLNIGLVPPPNPNDTCATPDPIAGLGAFAWDNTGSTTSLFAGVANGSPCLNDVTVPLTAAYPRDDVFLVWTVPADDAYSFDTGGTNTDTILQIYDGSDCTATCLASDDDGLNAFPAFPGESRIVLPGQMTGDTRLIQCGLWNGNAQTATGVLNISVVMPPANDTCSSPTMIPVGSIAYDNTITSSSNYTGSAGGAPAPGGGDDPGSDLFYEFTGNGTSWYQIDTLGTAEDTVLNVYQGSGCAGSTYLQNSDNEGSLQSRVFVDSAATGNTYMIQVGGWQAQTTAAGILTITELLPAPGPGNECSTAIVVGVGATAWDNTGMTTEGFSDGGGGACPTGFITAQPKQDMFFQFTAPADGDYLFNTNGTGADTVMMVHQGTGCVATCLGYSDDSLPINGESGLYAGGLLTGDDILVQVGTWGHVDVPTGVLNINAVAAPGNNDCSTPTAISGEGTTNMDLSHPSITTSGFEGGDPVLCAASVVAGTGDGMASDLFFAWTPDCDGDYQFSTDPTTGVQDTIISIHTGSDCSATCLANNDDIDAANFLSTVIVNGVLASDSLLIQVGMWDENLLSGPAALTITNLSGACPTQGILAVGCTPASPHLGGLAATMVTSTFALGQTPSGLQIQVTDGSSGEFGFILMSGGQSGSLAIFNGVLCLDAPQGRYNPQIASGQGLPQLNSIGQFDGGGILQNVVGTAVGGSGFDVPIEQPFSPAGQVIQPGDVFAFQCWYRDGASANFSDSILVQF